MARILPWCRQLGDNASILPADSSGIHSISGSFMALLPILRYPDPRLHKKAAPVGQVDSSIRRLAADMAETMYAAPGIGLAATQVDNHKQVIVIDVSEDKSHLLTLINPEILSSSGECEGEEGCLSVPGIYEKVRRAQKVKVRALGLDGQPFELEAEDLLAVCIQHEMDHLQGKVFVEYLSQLKQTRIKSKLAKQARITA
jgi:peptide deformylase